MSEQSNSRVESHMSLLVHGLERALKKTREGQLAGHIIVQGVYPLQGPRPVSILLGNKLQDHH